MQSTSDATCLGKPAPIWLAPSSRVASSDEVATPYAITNTP